MAVFQPSQSVGSEETAGSLQDVITLQDQARLAQVLRSAEPYSTLEDAYNVARGVFALGVTDSTRKVCKPVVKQLKSSVRHLCLVCIIWNTTTVGGECL